MKKSLKIKYSKICQCILDQSPHAEIYTRLTIILPTNYANKKFKQYTRRIDEK